MATTMTAFDKIERAHQMYRDGLHEEALGLYTNALAMAKTKAQKIALHSNRAACYLKLHNFKKAAEECTSVLELDHQHTGALMLRAQTLVTLKEYQSALFDVNRLMELNPSSDVYQNLQSRLKTQLSLAPIPEAEEDMPDLEEEGKEDEEEEVAAGGVTKKIESSASNPKVIDTKKIESPKGSHEAPGFHTKNVEDILDKRHQGWVAIPKPKGHSRLDYSRWDSVDDDLNDEDEDEEEEQQPQYRFRVRTVGVRSIK